MTHSNKLAHQLTEKCRQMWLLPAYTSEQNMLSEFSFSVPDRDKGQWSRKTEMTPVTSAQLTVCVSKHFHSPKILKHRKCYKSAAYTYAFHFPWCSHSFQLPFPYVLLTTVQCACSLSIQICSRWDKKKV